MIIYSSGKIVRSDVRQTKCKKCQANNKNGTNEPHDYMINWYGGSGAMETAVALDLCVDVYASMYGRLSIETIVSNEDSTIHPHLMYAENGGKL